MARVWLYHDFAQMEEDFFDEKVIEDNVNLNTLRLYSQEGDLLPLNIITSQQQLNLHDLVDVVKGDQKYLGNLQSINDKVVTIVLPSDNKVTIRDYDMVIYHQKTHLYTMATSKEKGILLYQTSALNWSCQGDIYFYKEDNLADFNIYAMINNTQQLSNEIDLSQLILISGKIPTIQRNISYEKTSAMMVAPTSMKSNVESSYFEDYMTFPLHLKQLNRGSTYLPLLSFVLERRRVYFYDLAKESSLAQVGYIFNSPQNFPSCHVNIHDNTGMFIGSSHLNEKRKGDDVRMYLGETSTVTTKTYLQTENIPLKENTFWSNTKVTFTSQIKNNKKNQEIVIARYYIGQHKITQATCQGTITDDGYLEFTLHLQPNDERIFNCSFILEA